MARKKPTQDGHAGQKDVSAPAPDPVTEPQDEAVQTAEPADAPPPEGQTDPLLLAAGEIEALAQTLRQQEDKYLRLAAEYDNFRKRSSKEKEASWGDSKAETVLAFLPVHDNLERALKQTCSDEAFFKGIEMTMAQLKSVLETLGVEEIPALGEPFDPAVHNAVMHIEDDQLGKNTVAEVFQAGFRCNDKVIRFAMVKVAN